MLRTSCVGILLVLLISVENFGHEPGNQAPLSLHQLQNTVFSQAPLKNGTFDNHLQDDPLTVDLGEVAHGDLNGDGSPDAAVVLYSNTGGSGNFRTLAIVLNENRKPRHVASTDLGDRVKILRLAIRDQIVTVEMLIQGPNDPMPDPTVKVIRHFRLSNTNTLVGIK